MQRSTDRILTTHVGSLIRPQALQEFLRAKQSGKGYDEVAYQQCLAKSVAAIVKQQADVGIDVVSDGEFGKSISWSQYVLERLGGFERRPFTGGSNTFARGADLHLVLAFVGIGSQMADVGDVNHVTHVVAIPFQRTAQQIFKQISTQIADVRIVIHGRTAAVQANPVFVKRAERTQAAFPVIVEL